MNPSSIYGLSVLDQNNIKRIENELHSSLGILDKEIRTVSYKKSPQLGLEFSIRGGRELGIGIFLSRVDSFSEAEKAGLRAGDQILSANGTSFESIPLQEAIQLLRSANILVLTLCNAGRVPYSCILHQTYTWVDRNGRKVSPPDEYEPQFHRSSSTWSLYSSTKSSKLRKVTLSLEEAESLGLMIRGGTEYGLGIFITGVDPDSAADRANLQVGDQILEVNEISFEDITHDEAVRILKNSKHLLMKILDVGKIPFSCTMYDEMLWSIPGVDAPDDLSSLSLDDELSSSDPCFLLSDPDTLKILNEKAKLLLTKKEHATLNYYRTEYEKGQVTLDAFVAVLLEILNTSDKFSLLAEIRELIPILDREKFDDIIYSREFEIKKTCQKLGPSVDGLIATRKANKSRRNSADCFKYVAIDKSTGKICLHPKCSPELERASRRSLSSVDSRRRIIPMQYDGFNRSMFLSSQALNWTTDDLFFDDSRTPSEDSGVDLPNGFYHGTKLPLERSLSTPKSPLVRARHYSEGISGSRGTEGNVGSASTQQRRGKFNRYGEMHSGSDYLPNPKETEHQPLSYTRSIPRDQDEERPTRNRILPQPSIYNTAETSSFTRRSHHVAAPVTNYVSKRSTQNLQNSAQHSATNSGIKSQEYETNHFTRETVPNIYTQNQTSFRDSNRGWGRHLSSVTTHNQHSTARGCVADDWTKSRPRYSEREWEEPHRSPSQRGGQQYNQSIRRSIPVRDGTGGWRNEETHSGDEATIGRHGNQRRQTIINKNDVSTAAALVSPKRNVSRPDVNQQRQQLQQRGSQRHEMSSSCAPSRQLPV